MVSQTDHKISKSFPVLTKMGGINEITDNRLNENLCTAYSTDEFLVTSCIILKDHQIAHIINS